MKLIQEGRDEYKVGRREEIRKERRKEVREGGRKEVETAVILVPQEYPDLEEHSKYVCWKQQVFIIVMGIRDLSVLSFVSTCDFIITSK